MVGKIKTGGPSYRKHLAQLGKANPEKAKAKEHRKVHETLVGIIKDGELKRAVRKYGRPIRFAELNPGGTLGYRYLEINPDGKVMIVVRELDYWADTCSQNHDSRYPLYVRAGKVLFTDEERRERYATEVVMHGPKDILSSLEKAIVSALPEPETE